MTANLQYMAPWNEDDAIGRATESHDVLTGSPPPAHLLERPDYDDYNYI